MRMNVSALLFEILINVLMFKTNVFIYYTAPPYILYIIL